MIASSTEFDATDVDEDKEDGDEGLDVIVKPPGFWSGGKGG